MAGVALCDMPHLSGGICVRGRCGRKVAVHLPCLWEKWQKRVFFDVSEDVVRWFGVAGVALCDMPRV